MPVQIDFTNKIRTISTDNNISASNKILDASNIQYDAADGVVLDPEFEVELGVKFEVKLVGCD